MHLINIFVTKGIKILNLLDGIISGNFKFKFMSGESHLCQISQSVQISALQFYYMDLLLRIDLSAKVIMMNSVPSLTNPSASFFQYSREKPDVFCPCSTFFMFSKLVSFTTS